jgi:DeoR/GlpR family transcriptional regulator of sugar metabolism
MTVTDIAAALGVSRRTARRDLARVRKRQERTEEAARLRAKGLSLRKIASRLGVTEGTVRGDLARWNQARMAAEQLRNPATGLRSENQVLDYALWADELADNDTRQPASGPE